MQQPSCADDSEPGLLGADEALQRIIELVQPLDCAEQVDLRSALNRVLSSDVLSSINVPAHTNSAMDGFALNGDDLPSRGVARLKIVGSALAGQPFTGHLRRGQCVRITTGACIPEGCDTVIMQERAHCDGDQLHIDEHHRRGENVRQAGEDLARGQVALQAGKCLTPADIGLIASMGIGEIAVTRRPRVAFFSTGDELCPVGALPGDGDIYDSNRYTLYGMLQRLGVEILDLGILGDDPQVLQKALAGASQNADMIVTSGGISVGEADYIKQVVGQLGKVDFWKLAIKPGRPLAFGKLDQAVFFGLPGNPVAVAVTFYQFVQPAIRYMQGQTGIHPQRFRARSSSVIRKKPGRTEYQRGLVSTGNDGSAEVALAGAQGSGILSSMSHANCLIILPPESTGVQPGDEVCVQPFHGLM